jgi:hypothetical protein
MQGVLALAIELWSFESPDGLSSPHFGSVNVILTLFQKWGVTSEVRSLKIFECKIFATLEAYNFLFKPSIEVSFRAKLVPRWKLSNDVWHAT